MSLLLVLSPEHKGSQKQGPRLNFKLFTAHFFSCSAWKERREKGEIFIGIGGRKRGRVRGGGGERKL